MTAADKGEPGTSEEAPAVVSPAASEPTEEFPAEDAKRPIKTLPQLFEQDKGGDLPGRLLASMVEDKRSSFTREEIDEALQLVPQFDPQLHRVRALVRTARQKHERRFDRAATDFARMVIAPELGSSGLQDLSRSVEDRFRAVVADQAPRLAEKASGVRALNLILLALEVLSDAGLTMEQAVPPLREALPEAQASGSSNPRRDRLARIAKVRITAEQLRQTLALIDPWERDAADARAEAASARRDANRAIAALEDARGTVAERDAVLAQLENELRQVHARVDELQERLRDAGSAGRSDVSSARARTLAMLEGRLRPILEMGREAADADPPRGRVVRRMVSDALLEVDKEIKWLTSSD